MAQVTKAPTIILFCHTHTHVCSCVAILSDLLTGCSSTKHFACACLALAFCVHWSLFIAGVTCWSGQTSTTLSLRGDNVSCCMHARSHTGIGAHFCTHACLLAILPAAATCCRCLPHLLPLLALRKPGPQARLCLPLCAALCNRLAHACHSPCLVNLLAQGCLPLHCLHLPFLPLPLTLRKQQL